MRLLLAKNWGVHGVQTWVRSLNPPERALANAAERPAEYCRSCGQTFMSTAVESVQLSRSASKRMGRADLSARVQPASSSLGILSRRVHIPARAAQCLNTLLLEPALSSYTFDMLGRPRTLG
jgi:hypothetical protein